VQGATKYLKTRAVITEGTRSKLGDAFPVRRLCKVRVVNIAEPVNLYELAPAGNASWESLKSRYEKALNEFEDGNFRTSLALLANLSNDFPEDGSTFVLFGLAYNALYNALKSESAAFDPVWELPGK
jgi:hypothetical protein